MFTCAQAVYCHCNTLPPLMRRDGAMRLTASPPLSSCLSYRMHCICPCFLVARGLQVGQERGRGPGGGGVLHAF